MNVAADTLPQPPAEPWRRRFVRTLLYGRNVDRAAKARARVGLAILAFAAVYAVIAVRLVMFAVDAPTPASPIAPVSGDAVATARPDILDRNGEILATDVRAPSLFAEPRRIIDVDEAIELLTACCPISTPRSCASGCRPNADFVWLKRDITPKQQARYPSARSARHRLPHREQARLSERPRGLASARPRQYRQPGHRRHREMARRPAGSPICTWRGSPPTGCRSRSELAVDLRVQHALRDELIAGARQVQGQGRRRPRARRAHRRNRRRWCRCRTTTRTIRARPTIRPASTA